MIACCVLPKGKCRLQYLRGAKCKRSTSETRCNFHGRSEEGFTVVGLGLDPILLPKELFQLQPLIGYLLAKVGEK